MKNLLLIIFFLSFAAIPISAKKKVKVQELQPDTCLSIVEPDSADADFSFPMISVGNVSFMDGSELLTSDSIAVESADSLVYQGFNKKGIVDFFVQNVVYPAELKLKSAEDYLKLRFDVDKEGKVKNPKVVDSKFPEMEKEVLRVVSKLTNNSNEPSAEKSKKDKKKSKSKDTTVEIPISFKLLKL